MSHVALRSDRAATLGAALSRPAARRRPFAAVEVHADPRAALDDWRDLYAAASASPYQSPDWLLPWADTVGGAAGVAPLIAVARDAGGQAIALLPLGLARRGGVVVASFLGGRHSNFNLGLFRPGLPWSPAHVRALLRAAATASPARIDLFALRNQPHAWDGAPNPLAALRQQPSPSYAYGTALPSDPEALMGRLSRDARKKLRQKAKRLASLGPVSLVEAGTPAEVAELLDAFAEQRTARNAAAGIDTGDIAALRPFLDRTVGGGGPMAFYGLRCGARIVATLGGARDANRFCGMLTSFDADPEVARASPGEMLLCEVMALHCRAGARAFDLGIGEARYKDTHCPEAVPLFDSLVAVTPRGHLFAGAEAARLRMKRAVKQSHWAWPLARRMRRALSRG